VLDTDSRIPYVRRRGDYLYNFWRDATNPRGLWRRTTLQSYRSKETEWDVILDVDELARMTTKLVWAGAEVIEPDYTLALVELSRGGADANRRARIRHGEARFRLTRLPPAGSQVQLSWEDHNTVLVAPTLGRVR